MANFKKGKPVRRRRFLRGMLGGTAVAIALPALNLDLNDNGDAFAQGDAMPDRFGVWFWGNGVRPEKWIPSGTGTEWTASEELAPLNGLRDHVSVVTGCEIKTATHPHHSGMAGIMTGARYHQNGTTRDTIVSTFAMPSVDMLAAAHFDGQTPFRSLEVGITRFRGTDEGTTFQHLSHNGPNNPNAAEYMANTLYRRLFGMPLDSDTDMARQSALDAVAEQISQLHGTVGSEDKVRLDQHLASVRQLERRIGAEVGTCVAPGEPANIVDVGGREQISEQNQIMSDLLTLGLTCDLTRAFSVLFSPAGSGVIMWPVGAANSLHQICHDEAAPQPTVHAATVFTMEQLSYFLNGLRDVTEGDATLLDRCSILCTSELSDGRVHRNTEFPILIAGRGNGRLRGGVHYRSTTNENTSLAVLTALRGAGVEAASFGAGDHAVNTTLSALEA